MAIRNSAKAIIIADGRILLTKNKDADGDFYLLPGGGQEKFEDIHEALHREVYEETSCRINIKDIRFIREYIAKRHEFAEYDSDSHQIEYMFECSLADDTAPCNGSIPDAFQTGVEFIPLSQIKSIRLYPTILKNVIHEDGTFDDKIYLGAVN